MSNIKEAIELLEKILKPLDACEPQCKLNLNPEKIRQVLALLKEQPPAGDFTKKFRDLIELSEKHLSNNKIGRLQTYGKEACTIIDQLESKEQPPAGEPNSDFIDGARCLLRQGANDDQWTFATLLRKACDRLDRSEAENKVYLKCVNEREEQCDKMRGEIKELEASRKELLTALEENYEFTKYAGAVRETNTKEYLKEFFAKGESAQNIAKAAMAKDMNKEISGKK